MVTFLEAKLDFMMDFVTDFVMDFIKISYHYAWKLLHHQHLYCLIQHLSFHQDQASVTECSRHLD